MSEPILIRQAVEDDAPALLAIYAPYVADTGITFEYTLPTVDEFSARIKKISAFYPYLVAEQGGALLGYAYATAFKDRAAYAWAAETTIYLNQEHRGKGIGTPLYQTLERVLRRQNICNANACIAYPNPGSIGFHERMGYRTVAHFTRCGYKLGVWYDMIWMEKLLCAHPAAPEPVLPVGMVGFNPVTVFLDCP